MTNDEPVLTNARVVLGDEVILGSVAVRDGRIADISTGIVAAGEDLDGDYPLPGIVELHTDHVEYHLRPRPGVHWEAMPAVLAHDAQMTAAGATTVLDAVRLGSEPSNRETVTRSARRLVDALREADLHADRNRQLVAEGARRRGITLAAHDDATTEPSSPIQAAFQLVADGTIRLEDAVKLISSNPAKAVGLDDRGEITVGRRGDLVRVRTHALPGTSEHPAGMRVPIVRAVYRQGVRVA
ncbi:amidohydrolase family protein [Streptomyces sp. 5-6(2022)]|uniref:amidohydrolase family protein n=1 Tax=Streptomyces sp. 5-6(2022) TaxID=2936510 RepID=UPI0023B8B986|nr:amidohydrolase family protein [Streptomyces sp. 5-6(2022)]